MRSCVLTGYAQPALIPCQENESFWHEMDDLVQLELRRVVREQGATAGIEQQEARGGGPSIPASMPTASSRDASSRLGFQALAPRLRYLAPSSRLVSRVSKLVSFVYVAGSTVWRLRERERRNPYRVRRRCRLADAATFGGS